MTRKTKDWATTVLKDKGEYETDLTLEEIQNIPVNQWKKTIKEKTTNIAISYLNNIVGTKSRTYKKLEMSPYLGQNDKMPIETAKFVAKAQSHKIESIKMNFKHEYKENLICNSCENSECNQAHLMYCKALLGSNKLITYIPNYEDIFVDTNIEEQCFIANILIENLKLKKELEMNKL